MKIEHVKYIQLLKELQMFNAILIISGQDIL